MAFADRYSLGVHQLTISHLEHTAIVLPPLGQKEEVQPEKRKKGRRYRCRHCPFTAKIYSALRPHYYAQHVLGSQSPFECVSCEMKFTNGKDLDEHNNSTKHSKIAKAKGHKFGCDKCGKISRNEKSFNFHEQSHIHPVSEKQLAKEEPTGIVPGISSKHLDFIESIKNLPAIQKVQCPECSEWTPKSRMYTHLRRHEGVKLFSCPYCPKNLASARTLRQHIHAHLQTKKHPCDKCDRSFSSKGQLKEHVNEKHSTSPQALAVCKQCGEKFPSGRLLYKHQLTHISAFKCTVPGCYYTTKYKYDLRVHMKTHENTKNFLCNLCGFAAKRKGGLLEHMKSHTNQRKFTCEYCDYKATTGAHLRRHMRIHIGAKPFSCHYCSFKCSSLDNLHKHIVGTKKHVGLPVYPCKQCEFGTNTSREFRNHLIGVHKMDAAEIGRMLTSYCGIYDKANDPKDIPEGACAIPVREAKQKSNKNVHLDVQLESNHDSANDDQQKLNKDTNQVFQDLNKADITEMAASEASAVIESIAYGGSEESSVILTMLPSATECSEEDPEEQDDTQVFPDIQALLRHLTQQQERSLTSDQHPGTQPARGHLDIQVQTDVMEVVP